MMTLVLGVGLSLLAASLSFYEKSEILIDQSQIANNCLITIGKEIQWADGIILLESIEEVPLAFIIVEEMANEYNYIFYRLEGNNLYRYAFKKSKDEKITIPDLKRKTGKNTMADNISSIENLEVLNKNIIKLELALVSDDEKHVKSYSIKCPVSIIGGDGYKN